MNAPTYRDYPDANVVRACIRRETSGGAYRDRAWSDPPPGSLVPCPPSPSRPASPISFPEVSLRSPPVWPGREVRVRRRQAPGSTAPEPVYEWSCYLRLILRRLSCRSIGGRTVVIRVEKVGCCRWKFCRPVWRLLAMARRQGIMLRERFSTICRNSRPDRAAA